MMPFKVFAAQNFWEIPLSCDPLPQLASFRISFSAAVFSVKKRLFRLNLCWNEYGSAEFCLFIRGDEKIFDYWFCWGLLTSCLSCLEILLGWIAPHCC